MNQEFQINLQRMASSLAVLPDKPDETAETTLKALWALAEGRAFSVSELEGYCAAPLTAKQHTLLAALIQKRLSGVPLAHLTARQDFMGLVLKVSNAALIPRRETEILATAAIEVIREDATPEPFVIDVCTGAGNLALAIAKHCPNAIVAGCDLSPSAVELARENAVYTGQPDVAFKCGDLLEPFIGQADALADLVVCNPPYISTVKARDLPDEISRHEPLEAFDGGAFGITILKRLIEQAIKSLQPNGWLLFEVGLGQGDSMKRMLARNPHYSDVRAWADDCGRVRAVGARRAFLSDGRAD